MKTVKFALAQIAMALLLVLPTVAVAQTQTEGTAEALRRLGATTTAYYEISNESDAVINAIASHLEAASAHAAAKTPAAEVQRWNASWTADTRSKVAALKTKIANAPRYSAEDVGLTMGAGRELEIANALNETPAALAKLMDLLGQAVEQISLSAPRMAAGEPEAELEMGLELLNMGAAAMKVENVTLTTQLASLSPSHPQYGLFVSARALNLAMIDLIDAMMHVGRGEPVDRKAVAASMRRHIAEAEGAARRIPKAASELSKSLKEAAATPTLAQVATKVQSASGSFEESAKVELQLAKVLSDAAGQVARSEEGVVDAAVALEKLDPLIERRTVLMAERAKALAE